MGPRHKTYRRLRAREEAIRRQLERDKANAGGERGVIKGCGDSSRLDLRAIALTKCASIARTAAIRSPPRGVGGALASKSDC